MKNLLAIIGSLFTLSLTYGGNPIIRNLYTADPAALVYKDTFYLYTGHDEAEIGGTAYVMKDWHVFWSTDMNTWTDMGAKLSIKTFSWASSNAWAGQCIHANGKFYWYVPMTPKSGSGFTIGVAVGDTPYGPFKDTLGKALITDAMTPGFALDIDPTIFIDDDQQAYLVWGNGGCKMVKLKSNMIEVDGDITTIEGLTNYTEAPWLHKKDSLYYLSYAANWFETIDYATSKSIDGPWTYRGRLCDLAYNSSTIHQAILEYKDNWYFVYHNGALSYGGDYRRSVCVDRLYYNEDGTIKKIVQTTNGTDVALTAINDFPDFDFKIYPNPSKGKKILIQLGDLVPNETNISIQIIDLLGKSVYAKSVKNQGEISMETDLSSGVYQLKIQSENQSFNKKILIEN